MTMTLHIYCIIDGRVMKLFTFESLLLYVLYCDCEKKSTTQVIGVSWYIYVSVCFMRRFLVWFPYFNGIVFLTIMLTCIFSSMFGGFNGKNWTALLTT